MINFFDLNDYSRKPLYKDIPLLDITKYGSKFWYLNDEYLTEKEFNKLIKL